MRLGLFIRFSMFARTNVFDKVVRTTEGFRKGVQRRVKERCNRPRHIISSLLEQFMSPPTTTKIDETVLLKVSDGTRKIVRVLDAVN